jgi:hypothetical protein
MRGQARVGCDRRSWSIDLCFRLLHPGVSAARRRIP